jgi:small subunit ribosomal protein S17
VETKTTKKTLVGTVVSDKMDKVVTVQLEIKKRHPIYKKFVKGHKKIKARNADNKAAKGDVVKLVETRPLSKDTRWRVIEIIEKAQRG